MVASLMVNLRRSCLAVLFVAGLLIALPARAAEKVHFSDFNDPAKISNEWSVATIAVPPADDGTNGGKPKKIQRRFLGDFTYRIVRFFADVAGPFGAGISSLRSTVLSHQLPNPVKAALKRRTPKSLPRCLTVLRSLLCYPKINHQPTRKMAASARISLG